MNLNDIPIDDEPVHKSSLLVWFEIERERQKRVQEIFQKVSAEIFRELLKEIEGGDVGGEIKFRKVRKEDESSQD